MRKLSITKLLSITFLTCFVSVAFADPSVQTLADGSTQVTTINSDGTVVVYTTHTDGTSTTEIQNPDGTVVNGAGSNQATTAPN